MHNLQGLLDNLLGGTCKLFTSRCVSHELKSLGPDFKPATLAARSHALHHCGHERPLESASECLMEQVGAANASHWVVATQDKALQAKLAKVPGAPVVFASVNGVHLSEPSDTAKALIASGTAAQQALPLHELNSVELHDLHLLRQRDEGWKKFRQRKARGPNPLAIKKKKKESSKGVGGKSSSGDGKKGEAAAAAAGGGSGSGGEEGAAAKKKRKRKRKGSDASTAAGGEGSG